MSTKTNRTFASSIALLALVASSYAQGPGFKGYGVTASATAQEQKSQGAENWKTASAATAYSAPTYSMAASARGDLKSGTLGAYAAAEITPFTPQGGNFRKTAHATATLWETVTFFTDGRQLGDIPLTLSLDGEFIGGRRGPGSDTGRALTHVQVYDVDRDLMLLDEYGGVSTNTAGAQIPVMSAIIHGDLLDPDPKTRTYLIGYSLTVIATASDYYAEDKSIAARFGNTLHFAWDTPLDIEFRSYSGVFNPPRIHPVPEPASTAALGLGAVAVLRRRRAVR